jgi:hypothetical protein
VSLDDEPVPWFSHSAVGADHGLQIDWLCSREIYDHDVDTPARPRTETRTAKHGLEYDKAR